MFVVSDTTPIVSLLKFGMLNVLNDLFSNVVISQGVFDEITAKSEFVNEI